MAVVTKHLRNFILSKYNRTGKRHSLIWLVICVAYPLGQPFCRANALVDDVTVLFSTN
jgi:hypothetical protein